MKHIRILSLVLVALMLSSVLASCGEGADTEVTTDGQADATADGTAAEEGETLSEAEQFLNDATDIDWQGETFGVLCSEAKSPSATPSMVS